MSTTSFNPASLSLNSAARLPVGGPSIATAAGDLNKDGKLDLVVPIYDSALSQNLTIALGNGAGSFDVTSVASRGSSPFAVGIADFNGDGNPDLVTANRDSDNVSLLLGNGSGGFEPATLFRVGSQPRSLAIGDFNGDGQPDVVTANAAAGTDSLSVLINSGNGRFRSAETLRTGSNTQPYSVAIADLNRDGDLDVITTNFQASSVSVFLGRGNGEFRDPTQFSVGQQGAAPASLVTGDFDGDRKPDIAVANFASTVPFVSVLYGDGKGGFDRLGRFARGGRGVSIAAADFNGDGHLDLATTNLENSTVSVLLNNRRGGFFNPISAIVRSQPSGAAVSDFDQDGKPDLAVTSANTTDISLVFNRTHFVVLRPANAGNGEIDGSRERRSSLSVHLGEEKLTINGPPIARYRVQGYRTVLGTQLRDAITGSSDRNILRGNGGNDVIKGLNGDDLLFGGEGNDRLLGEAGNDRLAGEAGQDVLIGGQGRDRFIFDHFDSADRLIDFQRRQDKLVLDRSVFTALRRRVSFAAVDSVSAAETSEALITYVRSTGSIYYNANGAIAGWGDGGLFVVLRNAGSTNGNLSAADFLTQR